MVYCFLLFDLRGQFGDACVKFVMCRRGLLKSENIYSNSTSETLT